MLFDIGAAVEYLMQLYRLAREICVCRNRNRI